MDWKPIDLKERLFYIDALRAFLMSWGVILHARFFWNNDLTQLVAVSSSVFRMPAFFLVSGFFTVFIFSRGFDRKILAKRLYLFLMPLIFFVIFINPLSNYLLAASAGFQGGFADLLKGDLPTELVLPLGISWHMHLWFLVVLAIYTLLYWPLVVVFKSGVIKKLLRFLIDAENRPATSFLILTIAVFSARIALRGMYFLFLEDQMRGNPFNHILVMSLEYFPYFCVGMLLFMYRPIFELFQRIHIIQLVVSLVVFAITFFSYSYVRTHYGETSYEMMMRVVRAFCSMSFANALFVLFQKFFNKKSDLSLFLSQASYSVYLFHVFVLSAFFYFFCDYSKKQPGTYVFAVVATYLICLLIHRYLVSPFALTRSLLNGKWEGASVGAGSQSKKKMSRDDVTL